MPLAITPARAPIRPAPNAGPRPVIGADFVGTDGDVTSLSDVVKLALGLPWTKLASWSVAALAFYQLHDFFGIMMGTFIVSFIGNGFVNSAQDNPLLRRLSPATRRHMLVTAYFVAIASIFCLFGTLIIPDVVREGFDFVTRLQTENIWVVVLEKMRDGLGDGVMDAIERFLLIIASDDVTHAIDYKKLDAAIGRDRTQYLGIALQKLGVSLILSFMMVWDLPRIARGVSSLRTSRLAPIYNTVAPSLGVFGTLFGKALQCQAQIALANTALTALGMWALRIPGVGLLSMFVFFCGFIPIAGVVISTVPIAFVALTEYGFTKLGLVLLMVTGVHFVEAYGLNPAIYSAHLKLHPLMVLSVLVFAEHSLGVWGLLLAVPLTVFLLDYCIRYPACSVTDVAARELDRVTFDRAD
ncbi:hypothetical protein QBZ16_002349 [Prototheca wickerhamii]|uniref:AI-2E family transporter n=1 Tax=Prototheca wickerhamii TaxID=3111 RepID=A0AAD9IK05_PROWI|nr:hypothetical protein QBZ16_002349 [Prototheca wickerhamii]